MSLSPKGADCCVRDARQCCAGLARVSVRPELVILFPLTRFRWYNAVTSAGGRAMLKKSGKGRVYLTLAVYCGALFYYYHWKPEWFPYVLGVALLYAVAVSLSQRRF